MAAGYPAGPRFSGGVRDGLRSLVRFYGSSGTGGRVNRDPLVQAFIPTIAIRDDGDRRDSYISNTALGSDRLPARQTTDGVTWRESASPDR
jgi:hypothetical protein